MTPAILDFGCVAVVGAIGAGISLCATRKAIRSFSCSLAALEVAPHVSAARLNSIPLNDQWTPRDSAIFTSLAVGLMFLAEWRWGVTWKAAAALLFFLMTLVLAAIDQKITLLPDALTIPLLFTGLAMNTQGMFAPLTSACVGATIGYGIPCLVARLLCARADRHFGFGDVKLLAAFAAWIGAGSILPILFIASLSALVFVVGRKAMFGVARPVPFGPFLALAGTLSLLSGSEDWLTTTASQFG